MSVVFFTYFSIDAILYLIIATSFFHIIISLKHYILIIAPISKMIKIMQGLELKFALYCIIIFLDYYIFVINIYINIILLLL